MKNALKSRGAFELGRGEIELILESKFNWRLTYIIESLRVGIKKESLKPNFTINAKITLFYLNETVHFDQNNIF